MNIDMRKYTTICALLFLSLVATWAQSYVPAPENLRAREEFQDDKFGISLCRGTDSGKYYSIIVNPEGSGRRKINFEEEGPEGKGFIAGIDGYQFNAPADNTYRVTVYTDNSVCVVYINDNVAYTNRIYGNQKNCWSINSYGGTIEVSDVDVKYY